MTEILQKEYSRTAFLKGGGAMVVGFSIVGAGLAARTTSAAGIDPFESMGPYDQGMIDSCIDCVDSWRHSSGHWRGVSRRHRAFGYDIRRGRNGIWYGTGIFAD